jgi:3-deoxy-manno-octulosonate cytidylyltransferase (CMP-KDO synthetase)
MKIIGVIPARMGSSRFPGKPLALLKGRPMIEHVYRRSRMCQTLNEVYVATCDEEIAVATRRFGGHVVMTSSAHERASDRVAEVATKFPADIVIVIQGDEPMIRPEMIETTLEPFRKEDGVVCVNGAAPIRTKEEFEDPNTIKVVMDRNGNALYFSRAPIPCHSRTAFGHSVVYKQVCIIPFRYEFLLRYTALPPTPLEQTESVDMLRILEHGYNVRLAVTDCLTQSVDTVEDLARVESLLAADDLIRSYGNH